MEFAPFGQDSIPLTREKKQNVECYIIPWNLQTKGVSKPLFSFYLLTINEPKAVMVCIDSSMLQTMTTFNKKFLWEVQGGRGLAAPAYYRWLF
jgi:hypothetical protein